MSEENRREKLDALLKELEPPETELRERIYIGEFAGAEVSALIDALDDAAQKERRETGSRFCWNLLKKVVHLEAKTQF